MLLKKDDKTADEFWREYEEKTGEKILTHGLGKYVSGWDEFDRKKWKGIWGLLITTSGGFRFHHFPQNSWIEALSRFPEKEQIKDKTIFIPGEKIVFSELIQEHKWWKKIFSSFSPQLKILYIDESENEKTLLFQDITPGFKNLSSPAGQQDKTQ